MLRCWMLVGLVLLTGCVRPPELPDLGLGHVEFEVSCNEEAQRKVDEGVALVHHLMFTEAERVFYSTTAVDAECAMAHWGTALARIRPLWPGRPAEDDLERGAEAIGRARDLGPPTARERAWVDAVAAYYETGGDDAARLEAWAAALEQLHRDYPDDTDAAAFHAVARLATLADDENALERRREIGQSLDALREGAPAHPGALLYLVLAYEHPSLAGQAREAATVYADLCHGVAQAEHLPTRISTRLGEWDEAIQGNLTASAAALGQTVNGAASLRFPLTVDYLMYAYLQAGWDRRAAGILSHRLARAERLQDDVVSAVSLAAIPARYHLEKHEWAEAAAFEPEGANGVSFERYPEAQAVILLTRAMGAARSGDQPRAQGALAEIEALRERASARTQVRIAGPAAAVAAWIALDAGKQREALRRMREAVELETTQIGLHVPPGPLFALRELLGDMLLELDRPTEALAAYETSLVAHPGRLNSWLGAARAARAAGDDNVARRYYERVALATEAAGSERPGAAEAREFLDGP